MAEQTQKEEKLKDEAEMRRLHKMLLQLEMTEMVHDLDLLPPAKEEKKEKKQ